MLRLSTLLLATACLCAAQDNIQALLESGSQKIKDADTLSGDERMAALDQAQSLYDRVLAIAPDNTTAHYDLGVIGWMRVFAALRAARTRLAMAPETPGPLPDAALRASLNTQYGEALAGSIAHFGRVLTRVPDHAEAMGYLNLDYRAKADLEDSEQAAREDLKTADHWVEQALGATRRRSAQAPPPDFHPGVMGVKHPTWINTPDPVYPPLAKQARIQGVVKLNAMISKEGTVMNLTVMSGHPILIPPAIEAARQWTCERTYVNGDPVEFATTIEITFSLNEN